MTVGWGGLVEPRVPLVKAPAVLVPEDVSLVIPVRNNQAGLDRFLLALARIEHRPREVVVVDSASSTPVRLPSVPLELALLRVGRPGAARARNAGWRAAGGSWILFSDSDCVPTETTLSGYTEALDGSVAYAGIARSLHAGTLASYYDTQQLLVPPPNDGQRPCYLVTANTLVHREALASVGGFDDSFPRAGGEDIDLAYRLRELGTLSYAPASVVLHDFSDGLRGFVERCVRYGRGNWLLERRHGWPHRPRPFPPARRTPANWVFAATQYLAMRAGYEYERRGPLFSRRS